MQDDTQYAARSLFKGAIPERQDELTTLWNKYSPEFTIKPDSGDDGKLVMQAGMYKHIWFNHRVMRSIWFGSFIAWEGYKCVQESIYYDKEPDFAKFNNMISNFTEMKEAENSDEITLPYSIPEPGIYLDGEQNNEYRAASEMATIATGWAFLHELKHMMLQQEGQSTTINSSEEKVHAEEYACDEFATRFVIEEINRNTNVLNLEHLKNKREISIYFALFTMTLLSHDNWEKTNTHPAVQNRMDRVVKILNTSTNGVAGAIGALAFGALISIWPDTPYPLKQYT